MAHEFNLVHRFDDTRRFNGQVGVGQAQALFLKRAEAVRSAALKRRAQEQTDLEAVAHVIKDQTFHFTVRTGEKGKVFGSITAAAIAEKLGALLGKEFDKRKVALREPIRDIGTHIVTVRLSADVGPTVNVVVTPEGAAVPAAISEASTVEAPAQTT